MENASKALIMAGSVLLSVLIISALVLLFNQIGAFKRSEVSEKDIEKLAEYTKQIETFNRELYGSELLSLCNLIEDYNARQADLGYDKIQVNVTLNNAIEKLTVDENGKEVSGSKASISKSYNSSKQLVTDFNKLQDEVNYYKNKKYKNDNGKSVEKLSGLKSKELKIALGVESTMDLSDISSISNSELRKFLSYMENYIRLKTDLTTFKNKKFTIEYKYDDNTLRVNSIKATEK